VGAAAGLVGELFDRTWLEVASGHELPARVRALGDRLVGRVMEAERAVASAGPLTLTHGDASARNVRTGPGGEVVFLDWEDVSAAPGVADLAWLLVSSVEPGRWDEVIAAYGSGEGLAAVLPAAVVQALLSFADTPADSVAAEGWISRLQAAGRRLEPS
jgi:aminoglycoside phosphotransferase (APT) family kinase protein